MRSRLAGLAVLATPVVAIVAGILVARQSGVSAVAFAPNLIALFLGSALWLVVRRHGAAHARAAAGVALVCVLLLAVTLGTSGQDGVRRWLRIGPLAVNVSAVVAPWLLWAIHVLRRNAASSVAIIAAVAVVHVLQPDAGQATAFGCAAIVVLARAPDAGRWSRALGVAAAITGAAIAWSRADPLAPVDHVERILHLARDAGPAALGAGLGGLALLVLPMRPIHGLASALATYVVVGILVSELGHFPVPVMGAGAGPVLGWYGAMAALTTIREEPALPGP